MPHLDGGLAVLAPSLCRLTSLSLQGCSTLSDQGLAKLACLAALESINLSECSGEAPGGQRMRRREGDRAGGGGVWR